MKWLLAFCSMMANGHVEVGRCYLPWFADVETEAQGWAAQDYRKWLAGLQLGPSPGFFFLDCPCVTCSQTLYYGSIACLCTAELLTCHVSLWVSNWDIPGGWNDCFPLHLGHELTTLLIPCSLRHFKHLAHTELPTKALLSLEVI